MKRWLADLSFLCLGGGYGGGFGESGPYKSALCERMLKSVDRPGGDCGGGGGGGDGGGGGGGC